LEEEEEEEKNFYKKKNEVKKNKKFSSLLHAIATELMDADRSTVSLLM